MTWQPHTLKLLLSGQKRTYHSSLMIFSWTRISSNDIPGESNPCQVKRDLLEYSYKKQNAG